MPVQTKSNKVNYVKVTFGFGTNKFGRPRQYRRGQGATLTEALINMFKQAGNNFFPPELHSEVVKELNLLEENKAKMSTIWRELNEKLQK